MTTYFCACVTYVFWYMTNAGTRVCHCGHPEDYHLNGKVCIGDVEINES